jgi:steroid 5-alpha reductase family enzyme
VLLFSLPMLVLVGNPRASISACEIAGVLVWVASVVGESVADRQLARFRADPATAGRVCRVGLWRIPVIRTTSSNAPLVGLRCHGHRGAVRLADARRPGGDVAVPAKLTGIPATENHALKSRGEEYRAYQRSTSAFVPWFPK